MLYDVVVYPETGGQATDLVTSSKRYALQRAYDLRRAIPVRVIDLNCRLHDFNAVGL